jgi:hypothetical protein
MDAEEPADGGKMSRTLLLVACVLTLVGLTVSVVHLIWPSPLNFALFMLVGQGTLASGMICYLAAVLLDLRRHKIL